MLQLIALVVISSLVSCSPGDNSTASDPASSPSPSPSASASATTGALAVDLKALPKVTDGVTAVAATDTSDEAKTTANFNSLSIGATGLRLAKTGVKLSRKVSDIEGSFKSATDASGVACETVNRTLKFLADASQSDQLQCVFRPTFADLEIYDGKDHILELSMQGGSESGYRFKVNITGSKTAIEAMKVWICEGTRQHSYIHQTIKERKATIYTKTASTHGQVRDCSQTVYEMIRAKVTGTLNDQGRLTGLKKMLINQWTSCGKSPVSRFHNFDITQSDKNVYFEGWTVENGTRRYALFYELLDGNTDFSAYALPKLAVGDGAGILSDYKSGAAHGWNGDTLSIDPKSERLVKVSSKTLTSPTTPEELWFSGEEVWDCTGTAESSKKMTQAALACRALFDIDQSNMEYCNTLTK